MSLADELLSGWAPVMRGVQLRPAEKGRFEVFLDGELIFSKAASGRHAAAGEIKADVEGRIGPPLRWRD